MTTTQAPTIPESPTPICQRKLTGLVRVISDPAHKGYSQVITQRQELPTMILQVIHKLRILSILLGEYFLSRSNRKSYRLQVSSITARR